MPVAEESELIQAVVKQGVIIKYVRMIILIVPVNWQHYFSLTLQDMSRICVFLMIRKCVFYRKSGKKNGFTTHSIGRVRLCYISYLYLFSVLKKVKNQEILNQYLILKQWLYCENYRKSWNLGTRGNRWI